MDWIDTVDDRSRADRADTIDRLRDAACAAGWEEPTWEDLQMAYSDKIQDVHRTDDAVIGNVLYAGRRDRVARR